ncbi:MAG: hypothetical protein K2X62_06055 [Beijerinckiaceae bacterium]|nr:hypothetical protein [Beijerinckiaceae bacterium]
MLATLAPDVHGAFRGTSTGLERVLVQDERHPASSSHLAVLATLTEDFEEETTRDAPPGLGRITLASHLGSAGATCDGASLAPSSARFCAHRATGPPTL